MPVHLHLLDAADAFGAMRERLAVVFDATVARVGEQLPLGPVDVVVYHDPRFVIPEIGIGATRRAAIVC
ncbi:hypothetical protein CLD22_17315 [Rubrivivax gelatinosus]|nr:hypothetical protein [Rubrivivax gelatinosus]